MKCHPYYAQRVLLFQTTDHRQLVLHILYDNDEYVSLGVFDSGQDYQALLKQAKRNYQNGQNDFQRYTVSPALVQELCQWF